MFLAFDLLANDYDSPIGKGFLFCEGIEVIIPTSLGEFREDIFSAGISFGYHIAKSENSINYKDIFCVPWSK